MCGIIGIVGQGDNLGLKLHKSLKKLEYRGYDSCGIAVNTPQEIVVKKDSGKIDTVAQKFNFDSINGDYGIAQTRWATHGAPNFQNSHPHLSCDNQFAIVHNGIIANYKQLKEDLIKKGHEFRSETDSEVFAHLIEENYKGNLESAVQKTLAEIKGTYALLVMKKDENKLIVARKESPLLIGVGRDEMYIGSDISSFLEYTNKAIALDDGEYATVTANTYEIKKIATGESLSKEIFTFDWSVEMAEKGGFEHFMLKEIHEQADVLKNVLAIPKDEILGLAKMILESDKVYITATGTSMNAALVSEYWFSQIAKKEVRVLDSSEFSNKAIVDKNTLVIIVTQSGETYDTLSALRWAKKYNPKTAAIVNVIGSTATRETGYTIMQGAGIEIAVCATKTYITQLLILLKLAVGVAKLKEVDKNQISKIEKEIKKTPKMIKSIIETQTKKIKHIAEKYCTVNNYIFISRGINLPSALEAALKFKEISYLHAEGMSGGILKHGTISLIDNNMHTVAIIPNKSSPSREKILSNIAEVKARSGLVISIICGDSIEDEEKNINLPEVSDAISPIIAAPAFQLLAYYTAKRLDRDIDQPRSLSKSVTVE